MVCMSNAAIVTNLTLCITGGDWYSGLMFSFDSAVLFVHVACFHVHLCCRKLCHFWWSSRQLNFSVASLPSLVPLELRSLLLSGVTVNVVNKLIKNRLYCSAVCCSQITVIKPVLSGIRQCFSTYRPNLFKLLLYWHTPVRPYVRLDCCACYISHRNNTSARSFFINNTFLSRANFLHETYFAGLIKHIVTTYWTHLRVKGIWASHFICKKQVTERCSLRDAFNRNVAIFIVYKWCHSNVIVIKLTDVTQN